MNNTNVKFDTLFLIGISNYNSFLFLKGERERERERERESEREREREIG